MKYTLNQEFFGHFSWGCYVEGYRDSVNSLLISIFNKKSALNKNELLPLFFLIRHYIELNLKEIIAHEEFLNSNINQKREHNLLNLWSKSKPKIIELLKKPDIKSNKYLYPYELKLKEITQFIEYLNKYDPDSFTFRYPVKTDFKSPTIKTIEIDIQNIHKNFMRLESFFSNLQAIYMTNEKYYK